MAPRKLSDSDKSELIDLYKQPGQTTTTLAEHFGVSNSTVSRILKSTIPPDEYRELISQKRMAGSDKSESAKKSRATKKTAEKKSVEKAPKSKAEDKAPEKKTAKKTRSRSTKRTADEAATPSVKSPKLKDDAAEETSASATEAAPAPTKESGGRRRRRRSNAKSEDDEQLPLLTEDAETVEDTSSKDESAKPAAPVLADAEVDDDEDDDDDDLQGLDETLGDDFGDDDLDEDDDEDDDDDDEVELPKPKLQSQNAMEIMSLGEAVLPKPCYLVVDMRSELITRPLSEFADLGQVPSSEEKAKTLPVFDNHRVARRFSRNKQRVIKVPDGNLITRTSPYLQAKGITRLLVNGQVFDLAE